MAKAVGIDLGTTTGTVLATAGAGPITRLGEPA